MVHVLASNMRECWEIAANNATLLDERYQLLLRHAAEEAACRSSMPMRTTIASVYDTCVGCFPVLPKVFRVSHLIALAQQRNPEKYGCGWWGIFYCAAFYHGSRSPLPAGPSLIPNSMPVAPESFPRHSCLIPTGMLLSVQMNKSR